MITFNIQEIIDNALRRCRIDLTNVNTETLKIAKDSVVYLLSEWAGRGIYWFQLTSSSYNVATNSFTVPTDLVDVLRIKRISSSYEVELNAYGPANWVDIPNKSLTGQTNTFFYNKNDRKVYLHPVPNVSQTFIMWYFKRTADETPNIPFEFIDAFTWGLALRIAETTASVDFNHIKYLMQRYQIALQEARNSESSGDSIYICPIT